MPTVRVRIPVRGSRRIDELRDRLREIDPATKADRARFTRTERQIADAEAAPWSGKIQLGTERGVVEYRVVDSTAEVDVRDLGHVLAGVRGATVEGGD